MARSTSILALLLGKLMVVSLVLVRNVIASSSATTYTNPILESVGADPFVVRYGDQYLMTYTTNDNITLLRSDTLTDWNNAESKLVFTPEPDTNYSYSLWAPELHQLNGKWYFIFTANRDNESPTPEQEMYCTYNCPALHHRMFVLESSTADPWESNYTLKSQLDTYDQFAIDGTYFVANFNDKDELYHIYSCWEDKYISWPAMLCISRMSDPWTVSSPLSERRVISRPTQPWEKTPYDRQINDRLSSNEGPQQLTNPHTNQTFIIYSAARSDNRNYCLGLIEFNPNNQPNVDPMAITSWRKYADGCVFQQNPEVEAFGVGHASFTMAPGRDGPSAGDESWIVYHGMRDPANGWAARTIRTQRFRWDQRTGWPNFGKPGYGPFPAPGF